MAGDVLRIRRSTFSLLGVAINLAQMVRAGETPLSALREREWKSDRAAAVVRREETVIALFAWVEADVVYGRIIWRVRLSGHFGFARVQTEVRRHIHRLPCAAALFRPARTRGNG